MNNPQNREQQTGRNPPPSQMTHNILPGMGNKHLVQFRNQINQQNANAAVASTSAGPPTAPPDVLNVNQHHHQQLQQQQQQLHQPLQHSHSSLGQQHHHLQQQHQQQLPQQQTSDGHTMATSSGHASELVTNFNNFNGSQQHMMVGPSAPPACGGGASNYNMNAAINLELNELKPKATKMLPKGSTGGSKRIRQIRERDQNNLAAASTSCGGVDLNLATTVIRQDSK